MSNVKRMEGSIKTCVYDSLKWLYGRDQKSIERIDQWFYGNYGQPDSWWKRFETKTMWEVWQIVNRANHGR